MSGGNIKVVVRCRPLNSREIARGAKGLIKMEGDQTILEPREITGSESSKAFGKKQMTFSFDKSYWSAGARDEPQYASQQTLYDDLGVELLDHSFEGFNTCIFAYGQTGSGKSYSMMGYGADKGIIPLTTSELFRRVEEERENDANLSYSVEVSYIEIYNEKVRDLLNPKNKGNLRVREHPSLGPYVEDLSRLVVENYGQMMTLMDEGNKARTVASTNMNETSSRSHAVFTVILTQKRLYEETKMTGEKVSKISLVDLAGSERQASTGASGTRLREGANINRSLSTLGKVIAALAQASTNEAKKRKKDDFVPYRDSVLTWLLKESLGGNSKTAMIAAISPADYEETLSTLRYADAAKRIKTHAVVNEDPNAKLIRDLKEELDMLRGRVANGGGALGEATYDPSIPPEKQIVTYQTKDGEIRQVTKLELQDQLQASEKLMSDLSLTWEQKMVQTQAIHVERERALEEMGISVDKDLVGVHAPQKHPSLVNLNEDPLMSECLVYQIKPGTTVAGSLDDNKAQIKLSGAHILPEHCTFVNEEGVVTVEAMPDARMFVNGKRLAPRTPAKLLNGFRVILGDFHVFRFNDPGAVRLHRQRLIGSSTPGQGASDPSPNFRPDTPSRGDGEMMDWSAARREVADIEKLGDHDLERLFDDIVKVRTQRRRPESKYDLSAELESRVISENAHGDNPWALQPSNTLTTNSLGTPILIDGDRFEPRIVDGDEETVNDRSEPPQAVVTSSSKTADAQIERDHLTRQLRDLASELRRTRAQATAARAMERNIIDPANWSARELKLVDWAVKQWKKTRNFVLAEQILSKAVDLKEANVIAHQMGKQVSYNLLAVHGDMVAPTSSLDRLNGVVEFEDVTSNAQPILGPCVVVKVLDMKANAVYNWDLRKFHLQLGKMRHASAMKERPGYSLHFRNDHPFTDRPAPAYSFVGAAKAPLQLFSGHLSYTVVVPIFCQYTMEAIGSCRVNLTLDQSSPPGLRGSSTVKQGLEVSTKFTFSITIDSVKGLSSVDFDSVHVQVRLSSLLGPSIELDDTYTSFPVELAQSSVSHLLLKRTISAIVTQAMIDHMASGYVSIEYFAKIRPEYLARLERFDRTREASNPASQKSRTAQRSPEAHPVMRRCERDFMGHEHHDVLAAVSISELGSDGTYVPAQVTGGVIRVRQGLQRRLVITLTHASGRSFPWTKITHVAISNVRAFKGGMTAGAVNSKDVELSTRSLEPEFFPDGTSRLAASGGWDSAAHCCNELDCQTLPDQTLVVRLTFLLEVTTLDEPAVFSLDIPLSIVHRNTRKGSWFGFFSNQISPTSVTAIFSVDLAPPCAHSSADLWRLDTAKKHVRGQESLENWVPRSLTLLEDFTRLKRVERGLADVQTTRAVLLMMGEEVDVVSIPPGSRPLSTESSVEGQSSRGVSRAEGPIDAMDPQKKAKNDEIIRKYLDLWRSEMEARPWLDIAKHTEQEQVVARRLRELLPDLEPKLVPVVRLRPKADTVIKQGYLMILRDSQKNEWEKMYFELRRPYLHVFPSSTEGEVQIIHLEKARVTASPEVEMLLGHRHAFTIFTPTNTHILQAASPKELGEWIGVIGSSNET